MKEVNQIPKSNPRFTFGYEELDGVGHYEPHTFTTQGTPNPFKWCQDYPPIRTPYSFSVDLSKADINITSGGGGFHVYIRDESSKIALGMSQAQMRSLRDILNAWEQPSKGDV